MEKVQLTRRAFFFFFFFLFSDSHASYRDLRSRAGGEGALLYTESPLLQKYLEHI